MSKKPRIFRTPHPVIQVTRRLVKRSIQVLARFTCPRFAAERMIHIAYLSLLSDWLARNPCTPYFASYLDLIDYLVRTQDLDGPILFLEMGVLRGTHLKLWLERISHREALFVGFDTFRGLPEDYGIYPAGSYSTDGKPPKIKDPRCSFRVGLFQETLLGFLREAPHDRKKVVYLDADLYSSTLYVLTSLAPYLKTGDILIFDEFASVRLPGHVFRAFSDFLAAYPVRCRPIGSSATYSKVAFRIEGPALPGA